MAYARIPLNFETLNKAYKDYMSLPKDIKDWLKKQNDYEDQQGLRHSTSCCMQASLSFNATAHTIPKTGSRDRPNLTLDTGKNYILSVDEFRAYLTYKYGPTDQVKDLASIKGEKGVLIFGSAHIEFWDGENIFQSADGAKKRGGNLSAVMAAGMVSSPQRWFWVIGEGQPAGPGLVPEWVPGWWTVYDGNYYYYYFSRDGLVTYIKTKPNPKWTPPMTIGNQGRVQMLEHGLKIRWKENGPPPATEETFTRVGWASVTEMNGTSNKYSPLFARKL